MCELCDESEDGIVSCQDCGRTICFDNQPSNVDVVDRAYVTASGDLFCRRCGRQYDEAEEEYYEEEDWGETVDYLLSFAPEPEPDYESPDPPGDYDDEDRPHYDTPGGF